MYPKATPYIHRDIILGIRSEDIYDKLFVSEAPPENIVRVNCEVYEPMGSEVYLYLNTGRHTFIARVGAHDKPKVNQDMDVVFDMSKVHLFDKDTEDTIV
jgi:multiple sugar transport system ATP-binding protein